MKRRSFLTGAGTAAVAATTLPAPAIASGKRTLKMVTTWPENFPGMGTSAARLAQRITDMTDGALTVKVYAADELVPALEAFDAVSGGAADIYHGAEYYWQGKSKAFNFFTAVPFGMTANEINAWIYHGGGQELWDELSAQFNVKAFAACNSGLQLSGWYRKEINSPEDLKGLKIRMPGLGGEVMRKLGAAAVTMAGSSIFPSLQSGAIDATEWVGPWNDMAFGFYQVADYYYWPGWHEPGSCMSAGFNLTVWNSLTHSQKEVVKAACAAENDYSLAEYNHFNGQALKTLVEKHGVKLRRFSPEILTALKKASAEVLQETADADPYARKVYDSFSKSLALSKEWTRIGDQAFVQAREDA